MPSRSFGQRTTRGRFAWAAALALAAAACADSTSPGTSPSDIDVVAGADQSGPVGSALPSPIVVEVTSSTNAPLQGVTVAFSITSGSATTSPTTAVTDANGQASTTVTLGSTVGTVEVTGTVQGTSLAAQTTATATDGADADCSSAPSDLTVGQVITGITSGSLCIAGGNAGGEFALVPFNGSASAVSSVAVTVEALGISPTVVASLTPTAAGFNLLAGTSFSTLSPLALTRALDAQLRATEARELARLIPGARSWMAKRATTTHAAGLSLAAIPSNPTVGQLLTLNSNAKSACSSPVLRTGRVVAVSSKAVIVADTTNPAAGFTVAEYQGMGATFDDLIDPMSTQTFGAPTDIDGNNRVLLFFTRAVNELTPSGSSSYVGGFFFARDLLPATGSADFEACPASNGGEMFYLMVPDPTGGVNGNKFTKNDVRRVVIAIIAHEYQHLINASRRMYVNTAATDFEETWLDEGLSHVAEELLFFAETRLSPRANIDAPLLRSSSAYIDAFNNEAISNFSRLGRYLAATGSNSPFAPDDELETRGATWSFLRYATDHRASTDGSTWYQLTNSTTTGIGTLAGVFGADLTSLARDWSTSVFSDDLIATGTRYQQPTWNHRSIYAALQSNGAYPLATIALTNGTPATVSMRGGSAAYLRFTIAAGQNAAIQLSTLPSTVQLSLVRTR